jgi:hypothetical protein
MANKSVGQQPVISCGPTRWRLGSNGLIWSGPLAPSVSLRRPSQELSIVLLGSDGMTLWAHYSLKIIFGRLICPRRQLSRPNSGMTIQIGEIVGEMKRKKWLDGPTAMQVVWDAGAPLGY